MYAYLRVSTDQQVVANQRYGLLVYAKAQGLGPFQFVEDTASGRLAWRDWAVGRLLTGTVHPGDPVEGQITRLKLLKRQIFGCASLARLERRFVLASGRVQAPLEAQVRPAAA